MRSCVAGTQHVGYRPAPEARPAACTAGTRGALRRTTRRTAERVVAHHARHEAGHRFDHRSARRLRHRRARSRRRTARRRTSGRRPAGRRLRSGRTGARIRRSPASSRRDALVEATAARRQEVAAVGAVAIASTAANSGSRHQHHARAAAERTVVDGAVRVVGPLARIVHTDVEELRSRAPGRPARRSAARRGTRGTA